MEESLPPSDLATTVSGHLGSKGILKVTRCPQFPGTTCIYLGPVSKRDPLGLSSYLLSMKCNNPSEKKKKEKKKKKVYPI
jgi:hypothetical protein